MLLDERKQKRVKRQSQRNPVGCCGGSDGDRIGNRTLNLGQTRRRPRGLRCVQEAPALLGCLEIELSRRRERQRQRVHAFEGFDVLRLDGPIGMGEQDGVTTAYPQLKKISQPHDQRCLIPHIPDFDRPFEPM